MLVNQCVKSLRIRSYSDPHFPAFGLNTCAYISLIFVLIPISVPKTISSLSKSIKSERLRKGTYIFISPPSSRTHLSCYNFISP